MRKTLLALAIILGATPAFSQVVTPVSQPVSQPPSPPAPAAITSQAPAQPQVATYGSPPLSLPVEVQTDATTRMQAWLDANKGKNISLPVFYQAAAGSIDAAIQAGGYTLEPNWLSMGSKGGSGAAIIGVLYFLMRNMSQYKITVARKQPPSIAPSA